LLCSRLNRNADKGGLDFVVAIREVVFDSKENLGKLGKLGKLGNIVLNFNFLNLLKFIKLSISLLNQNNFLNL
jgi:hypothetical protein